MWPRWLVLLAVCYHYKCRGCTAHTLPRFPQLSGMGGVRRRSSGGAVDLELDNRGPSNEESGYMEEAMDQEKQLREEEKVEI